MQGDVRSIYNLSCFYRFGDTVQNEFYLSTYQTRNQLLSALSRLGYNSLGSRRNVQEALNAMRTQQFIASQVRFLPQWSHT